MTTMARALALGIVLAASSAQADIVIWDESVHGDLSGDRLIPTPVNLALGINTLIASSLTGDREYVRMTIPAGMNLSGIVHVSWVSTDPLAFIGVQQGASFTEPPTGTNVANVLGYTHFGPGAGTLGLDILPAIGTGPGAIGFTPPLPGNVYTFWIQQTGASLATYRLDFVVAPSPGTGILAAAGLFGLARRRRQRA